VKSDIIQLQTIYDIIQSYEWLKRKQLRQQKENNKKKHNPISS
jgi:hypothetical protein